MDPWSGLQLYQGQVVQGQRKSLRRCQPSSCLCQKRLNTRLTPTHTYAHTCTHPHTFTHVIVVSVCGRSLVHTSAYLYPHNHIHTRTEQSLMVSDPHCKHSNCSPTRAELGLWEVACILIHNVKQSPFCKNRKELS